MPSLSSTFNDLPHSQISYCPSPSPPKGPHLLVCPGEVVFHSGWGSHHECPQRLLHQRVDAGDNEDSYRHGADRVRQHPPWGWVGWGCSTEEGLSAVCALDSPNCPIRNEEMMTPTLPSVSARIWRNTPTMGEGCVKNMEEHAYNG